VPYSNVQVYEEIVYEAYSEMNSIVENGRTAKEDGSGYIIKYDSTQASFKKSMIVVVFAGMWLEATFHQFMVTNHSKNQFTKHNNVSYREKLELMGIKESDILAKTEKFQKTRNELIHEKSFMDKGDIKLSQNEAEAAHEIISYVSSQFRNKANKSLNQIGAKDAPPG
jgi:molybdopterin-biosynthesis enzyme MoeA-like protein